jgi:hypothetical protein
VFVERPAGGHPGGRCPTPTTTRASGRSGIGRPWQGGTWDRRGPARPRLDPSQQGDEGYRQQHRHHYDDVDHVSLPIRLRIPLLHRRKLQQGWSASARVPRLVGRRAFLDGSAQALGLGFVHEASPSFHQLPRHRRRRAPYANSVRLELERHSSPPRPNGHLDAAGGRSRLVGGNGSEAYDV